MTKKTLEQLNLENAQMTNNVHHAVKLYATAWVWFMGIAACLIGGVILLCLL